MTEEKNKMLATILFYSFEKWMIWFKCARFLFCFSARHFFKVVFQLSGCLYCSLKMLTRCWAWQVSKNDSNYSTKPINNCFYACSPSPNHFSHQKQKNVYKIRQPTINKSTLTFFLIYLNANMMQYCWQILVCFQRVNFSFKIAPGS